MKRTRKIIILNIAFLGVILFSIIYVDKPLSAFVADELMGIKQFFFNFTFAFDRLSYHILWFITLSFVLGLMFLFNKKTKELGFILLTLCFAHVTASAITNNMKMEFKRARPNMYFQEDGKTVDFYNEQTRDYSFPSGHTSFYLSLFLPAALVFRRYSPYILFIPAVIALGRIIQNEHYLSDVLCSILIVFNVCILLLWLFYWLDNTLINFKNKRIEKRKTKYNTKLAK